MGTWSRTVGAGLALILAGVAPGMAQGAPLPGSPPGGAPPTAQALPAAPGGSGAGEGSGTDGAAGELTLADGSYQVTLITGDVVRVTQRKGGAPSVVITPAERADGRVPTFAKQLWQGHYYVIPDDVADLVPTQLDRRLFDVTGLIAAGYDDDSTSALPVIVQTRAPGTKADPARGVDWKGLGVARGKSLRSIGSVAAKVDKGKARGQLVDAVKETEGLVGAETHRGIVPSAGEAAGQGITKVWLDGRVKALDATSTPQVGAPQAWEAGYTGEGITVAVLDTGVDAEHPDLADAVVAAEDFSGTGNPDDVFGHGTHVAGIITGNGAASGGEIVGVAPDVQIMNGKVLDDSGFGSDSGIIAGMEWAATGGADVVNMSLGASGWYTDGTDPMALAVDEISAATDVLFVIAAGNDGGYTTISTPGSSSLALTVSAVDANDMPTWFTSRGPRVDGMAKPDIAAPGEEILAPQVGYPAEASEPYIAHSGTSMATPHVVGVAALLAQARPELDSQQLKSILVGSADDVGASVFDVGSGRVFAPSAIDQQVYTTPSSLGFGIFPFPQDALAPSTQTLTYTNSSDTELTLALSVEATLQDGSPAPAGAITLGGDEIRIPAGGSSEVTVTVDPAAAGNAAGRVGGVVVATDGADETVRTAVMSVNEAEMYDLTIVGSFRDGSPAVYGGTAGVTPLGAEPVDLTFEQVFPDLGEDGTATVRLPAGTYGVMGVITQGDWETGMAISSDALNIPEVALTQDTTVHLDASGYVPVTVETFRPTEQVTADHLLHRAGEWADVGLGSGIFGADASLGAVPSEPVSIGAFQWMHRHFRIPPGASLDTGDYRYLFEVAWLEDDAIPADLTYAATRRDVTRVRADYNSMAGRATTVVGGRYLLDPTGWAMANLWPIAVPIVRDEYVNAEPGLAWWPTVDPINAAPFERVQPWEITPGGSITERWLHQVHHVSSATGGFVGTYNDGYSGWLVHSVPMFVDDHGHAAYFAWDESVMSSRIRMWLDGELVADQPGNVVESAAPAAGTPVRVKVETSTNHPDWVLSTSASTDWSYRVPATGGEAEMVSADLLNVRYGLAGVDDYNATQKVARLSLRVLDGDGDRATGVKGVKVWMSTNDGGSWKAVKVTGKGADRKVMIKAPKGADTISLKVQAWTKDAKVTDQVIDAIDVR
ncbi:S8 family serine peptidase [Ornithinimicrobium panacihumi]|uniref:S8 family serine peptidase n=1 Tax=Ornithinimicrobium panacihumi TaxID=2008449 RepID=UPI003F8B2935